MKPVQFGPARERINHKSPPVHARYLPDWYYRPRINLLATLVYIWLWFYDLCCPQGL